MATRGTANVRPGDIGGIDTRPGSSGEGIRPQQPPTQQPDAQLPNIRPAEPAPAPQQPQQQPQRQEQPQPQQQEQEQRRQPVRASEIQESFQPARTPTQREVEQRVKPEQSQQQPQRQEQPQQTADGRPQTGSNAPETPAQPQAEPAAEETPTESETASEGLEEQPQQQPQRQRRKRSGRLDWLKAPERQKKDPAQPPTEQEQQAEQRAQEASNQEASARQAQYDQTQLKNSETVRPKPTEYVPSDPEPAQGPKAKERPWTPVMRRRTYQQVVRDRELTERAIKRQLGRGNGLTGQVTSNPNLGFNELSFGLENFLGALHHPKSLLRKYILSKDPNADIDLMLQDEGYAWQILDSIFNDTDNNLFTMKHPTPDGASAHNMIIRVHRFDPSQKVSGYDSVMAHPLAEKMYNMDNDGDTIFVSFDTRFTVKSRSALDWLIGEDRDVRVDKDFFAFRNWWGNDDNRLGATRDQLLMSTDIAMHATKQQIDKVAEALVDSVMGKKGAIDRLMRAIRDIGQQPGAPRMTKNQLDNIHAKLISDIYNTNRDQWAIYDIAWNASNDYKLVERPQEHNKPPADLADLIAQDLVAGELPANFHDYVDMMRQPMGYIENKSVQFRELQNPAKGVNRDARFKIGTNRWGIKNDGRNIDRATFQATCDEAMTKAMSSRVWLGEADFQVAQWLRGHIIKDAGMAASMLDEYGRINCYEWSKKLFEAYNKHVQMLNAASVNIRMGGQSASAQDTSYHTYSLQDIHNERTGRRTIEGAGFDQLANVVRRVYGDFTMFQVFGYEAPKGSEGLTVNEWIQRARVQAFDGSKQNNKIREMNEPHNTGKLLQALANLRTSQAGKFAEEFAKATDKIFDGGKKTLLKAVMEKEYKNPKQLKHNYEKLSEALFMLASDPLRTFEITDWRSFFESGIGKRMIEAKSADHLRGIVMEMHARMRMKKVHELEKRGKTFKVEATLDEIATISDAWHAVVADMRRGGEVYKKMVKNQPPHPTFKIEGKRYWDKMDPDAGNAYEGILLNEELTGEQKALMLTDIVRQSDINKYALVSEAYLGIMGDPKGLENGPRSGGDYGKRGLLDNFKASSDAIDAYNRESYEKCVQQIRDARKQIRDNGDTRALSSYLRMIADGSAYSFEVNDQVYIDALVANMRPTYSSSEKSQQEHATNALYTTLAYKINDGLWSDQTLVDAFAKGEIAYDRFVENPGIIVRLLAEPDLKLRVFDGDTCTTVDRAWLLGGEPKDLDKALWKFLEEHPRVAMALRRKSCVANTDGNGVYPTATSDLAHTLMMREGQTGTAIRNRILGELANRPLFAQLLTITVPHQGRTATQIGLDMYKQIDPLINELRFVAQQDAGYRAQYVRDLAAAVATTPAWKTVDVDEDVPGQIEEAINKYLGDHLDMIAGMHLPPMMTEDGMRVTSLDQIEQYDLHTADPSAMRAFFDVGQQLIGAQTEISTGINGAETQRHAMFAWFADYRPEEQCASTATMDVPVDDWVKNWPDYEGMRTTDGRYVSSTNWQEIMRDYDSVVMLEDPASCSHESGCACERHATRDPSTSLLWTRTFTAISRWFVEKRNKATEMLNLQRKKYGDDGTDKIVKFDVWATVRKANQVRKTIEDASTIEEARRLLAQHWMDVDRENRYEGSTYADYLNMAQRCIREREGGGGFDVWSLEQLSAAVTEAVAEATRINPDMTDAQYQEVVHDMYRNYDPHKEGGFTPDDIGADLKVTAQSFVHNRVTDKWRSSVTRNLQMINTLRDEYEQMNPASALEADENVIAAAHRNNIKKLKNALGLNFQDRVPFPYGFKVLGVLGANSTVDQSLTKAIGPTMAWVIMPDASPEEATKAVRLSKQLGIGLYYQNNDQQMHDILEAEGDLLQICEGDDMWTSVPWFDIRLNGANTEGNMGAFNVGTYMADKSNFMVCAIDPYNTEGLGDADLQAFQDTINRVRPTTSGKYKVSVNDMFPVFLKNAEPQYLRLSFPTKQEIEQRICLGKTGEEVVIDTGDLIDKRDSEEWQRAMEGIAQYISRFEDADEHGLLGTMGKTIRPDEVIGFVKAQGVGPYEGQEMWHPLRVGDINIGGENSMPQNVQIADIAFLDRAPSTLENGDAGWGGSLQIDWKYESSIQGYTAKYFEENYGGTKGVVRSYLPDFMPDRKLRNGIPLNFLMYAESVASRLLGVRNQKRMTSLFTMARLTGNGYNLADHPGGLANEPDIKQKLQDNTIRIGEWKRILDDRDIEFFSEMPNGADVATMNAWANEAARTLIKAGVNPSVFFASHFHGFPSNLWFRFDVMIDMGTTFQDCLMAFFNYMDPSLCPPSRDGDYSATLFNDQLQMLVPLRGQNNTVSECWCDVFVGLHYFDRHFSGFSQPGRRAVANRSTFVDETLRYLGRPISNERIQDHVRYAMRKIPTDASGVWWTSGDEED